MKTRDSVTDALVKAFSTGEPLTVRAVSALAGVVNAAYENQRVTRLLADGTRVNGTARAIGDDRGNFIRPGEDVRSAIIRVTTEGGFEAFWPVPELAAEYALGTFLVHDWRR